MGNARIQIFHWRGGSCEKRLPILVMKEWQFWENPNKFPFDKFSEIQLYFLNGKAYNKVGNKSNFLCAFDG
ncbi:hypothetical protein C804_05184 [Lachnospiraceae bacterium A4]|nr:hypothetical protein C804_05184 [Lachnospiraceae bacterium A4]